MSDSLAETPSMKKMVEQIFITTYKMLMKPNHDNKLR